MNGEKLSTATYLKLDFRVIFKWVIGNVVPWGGQNGFIHPLQALSILPRRLADKCRSYYISLCVEPTQVSLTLIPHPYPNSFFPMGCYSLWYLINHHRPASVFFLLFISSPLNNIPFCAHGYFLYDAKGGEIVSNSLVIHFSTHVIRHFLYTLVHVYERNWKCNQIERRIFM